MPITIIRRKGENIAAFLNRVSKVITRSGVLIEARKKKFHSPKPNKRSKKVSALHRIRVKKELEVKKRKGLL